MVPTTEDKLMQSGWRDITQEVPVKSGWYFLCINENGIVLRSLSITRSGQGEIIKSVWDFGEHAFNEPLDTYRYWQPVRFPQPPGGDEEETEIEEEEPPEYPADVEESDDAKKEELIGEAMGYIGKMLELLHAAAYSGDTSIDIVKICCSMGRSIELGVRARDLLDQILEGEY